MKYEIVNPADWMPRIIPLLLANWAETGFDFEFKPDLESYARLYDAGLLFAVAALDGDECVGYATVAVIPHPHNREVIMGSNDALFVDPVYRNGLVSGRIIKTAEREAKARGATHFYWHTRAGTPLSEILLNHGYQPADVVVMRAL